MKISKLNWGWKDSDPRPYKPKNKSLIKNMKIETKENQTILKEVYNTITLETREGKQLHICMRDNGFEIKIDNSNWFLISEESDFIRVERLPIF